VVSSDVPNPCRSGGRCDAADLGQALRAWRDRTSPEAAGLGALVTGSGSGPRRTSGLRREELALLAGVSVDYVTRLEQGRATSPSAQVAGALARALRLEDAEQRHLFRLAGLPEPGPRVIPTALTPGVTRLLGQLDAVPVSVYDAAWNLIAWNPIWAALVGDPGARAGRERNVIWQHFTGQRERIVHTAEDDEAFGRSTVAALRAATGRYPDDAGLQALVADLLRGSSEFTRLWRSQLVGAHENDRKQVVHPEVGAIWVDCDVLHVEGPDLHVVVYTTTPGSPDAEKLRRLGASVSALAGHPA
jgi:transcriptional regulator with XRE-family HTH domain